MTDAERTTAPSPLSPVAPGSTGPSTAADAARAFHALRQAVEIAVVGADEPLRLLAIALLADGHALIEDVPGVGKTLLARAFSSDASRARRTSSRAT